MIQKIDTRSLYAALRALKRPAAPASGAETDSNATTGRSPSLAAFQGDSAAQVSKTLADVVRNSRTNRSSQALERLHQLVQQARVLKMMGGGDPKVTAGFAHDLAKQIAAAAKDYSGSANPNVSAVTTSVTADGSKADQDAQANAAQGDAAAKGATDPNAAANAGGQQTGQAAADAVKQLFREVKHTLSVLRKLGELQVRSEFGADRTLKEVNRAIREVSLAEGTIGQHDEAGPPNSAGQTDPGLGTTVNLVA